MASKLYFRQLLAIFRVYIIFTLLIPMGDMRDYDLFLCYNISYYFIVIFKGKHILRIECRPL